MIEMICLYALATAPFIALVIATAMEADSPRTTYHGPSAARHELTARQAEAAALDAERKGDTARADHLRSIARWNRRAAASK